MRSQVLGVSPGIAGRKPGGNPSAFTSRAPAIFHKVGQHLYRLESSGTYYALLKRGGKQIRKSLKTADAPLARRRLAELRNKVSRLHELDPAAARSCLRRLDQLRAERERAADEGQAGETRDPDGQIEAIAAAVRRLLTEDRREREFGLHLNQFVGKGYRFSYVHPQGAVWA